MFFCCSPIPLTRYMCVSCACVIFKSPNDWLIFEQHVVNVGWTSVDFWSQGTGGSCGESMAAEKQEPEGQWDGQDSSHPALHLISPLRFWLLSVTSSQPSTHFANRGGDGKPCSIWMTWLLQGKLPPASHASTSKRDRKSTSSGTLEELCSCLVLAGCTTPVCLTKGKGKSMHRGGNHSSYGHICRTTLVTSYHTESCLIVLGVWHHPSHSVPREQVSCSLSQASLLSSSL